MAALSLHATDISPQTSVKPYKDFARIPNYDGGDALLESLKHTWLRCYLYQDIHIVLPLSPYGGNLHCNN